MRTGHIQVQLEYASFLRPIRHGNALPKYPMTPLDFNEAISQILGKDPRYQPPAYDFVREALGVAVNQFRGKEDDQHVTGQQLLEGVRSHALEEFGPMALTTLDMWGIRQGEDVGNIVYNLIDVGYFGKNEGDTIEDFSGGYDFEEAFLRPFQPLETQSQPRQESL